MDRKAFSRRLQADGVSILLAARSAGPAMVAVARRDDAGLWQFAPVCSSPGYLRVMPRRQGDSVTSGPVLDVDIPESQGQHRAKIFTHLNAGGYVEVEQWSFERHVLCRILRVRNLSIAEVVPDR